MLPSNSLIRRAKSGMPSGPEEDKTVKVKTAQSSAFEMGTVTSGGSKSGETTAKSSSSLIGEGGDPLRIFA